MKHYHLFGLGPGRVPPAGVVIDRPPAGDGWLYWMETRSRGEEHDAATERAVTDRLTRAGLWPPTSEIARTVAECLHDPEAEPWGEETRPR